ncbi:hypothetical protein EBU95_18800, partial [bacterium]|nr:hypothetical protein [bacterium]
MDAREIIAQQAQMASKRSNWESLAQETCRFIAPEYAIFNTTRTEGMPLHNNIFDTTANSALDIWVSILNFMLTPRNRQWHKLQAKDEKLRKDSGISAFLENATKNMFSARYAPYANFASQVDSFYKMDGLLGNACLFVDYEAGKGLRYKNIPTNEIFFLENHQGVVDNVHRKFTLTASQAVKKWGDACPQRIKTASDDPKKEQTTFNFVHCVKINPEYNPRVLSPDRMRFSSYYVCVEENITMQSGGYRTMPYIISRYQTAPDEIYGRSPAMAILPVVKKLNTQLKSVVRSGQLSSEPPLISMNLTDVAPFNMRAGALNMGFITDDGQDAIRPLSVAGRIDIGLEFIEMDRKDIEAKFFANIYQILIETPNMTATEVMQRTQEKGQLLAPTMGRKQSEFLGALIEREIDLLSNVGLFDGLPQELQSDGDTLDIAYDTEMTRMMRADEGVGIIRTLETVLQ